MKTLFAAAALLTVFSATAFARDSSHLVCTGFMAAKPDPDNYGISFEFDESRAPDGENRTERLSSIWAGDLYTGSRLNKGDEFGKNGKIEMALKENTKKVFYKGDYSLDQDAKHAYKLKLKGQLNTDPNEKGEGFEAIATTLNCVDLSN